MLAMRKLFIFLLTLTFFYAQGQEAPSVSKPSSVANYVPDSTEQPSPPNIAAANIANPMSSFEFTLSILVLIFGLLVLLMIAILSYKKVIGSDQIFKCIIITLIIIASLLLITAGYSNNQITGITGIMGSIAGYLLGKSNNKNRNEKLEKQ